MVKPIRFMTLTSAIAVAMVSAGLHCADASALGAVNVSAPVQVNQAKGAQSYIIAFTEEGLLHNNGGNGMQATAPGTSDQRKLDVHSSAAVTYRSYLQAQRDTHLNAIKNAIGRPLAVSHVYSVTRNGVAAKLTDAEAAKIAQVPGVKSVRPAGEQQQVIYRGPKFIGADTIWNGTNTPTNVGTKGKGIVFADLDGGTSSGNPLFANDPACGFRASQPKLIPVDCSVTDVNGFCAGPNPQANPGFGHGVHTSSTVAGNTIDNTVTPAPLLPNGVTMSGVAPCAAIRHYKVCQTNSCAGEDILAGIENAIADQVDVLNFSISGGTDPWNDNDRDFLDAVNADVFVAAAAGNLQTGETDPHGLVNHLGPWVITVAASTQDQIIGPQAAAVAPSPPPGLGNIQLTPGSTTLVGTTVNFASMPILSYPTNNIGCTAGGGFPAHYFDGAVALIRRGTCSFVEKITNATAAGAAFVLVANNQTGSITMATTGTTTPSFSMSQTDGDALFAFVDAHDPPAPPADEIFASQFETFPGAATVAYDRAVQSATQGDVIAGFSYRGPVAAPSVNSTKPDISAPGVNIYAGTDPASGDYQFMSGTSMATPHVTGSAALVRSVHPDWTVTEVKSALMMTSTNANGFEEDGTTPWTVDDVGSGRVDLTKAALAGLTMDETVANFIAADPTATPAGDVKTLNLPLLRNSTCNPNCTWTRTFKNRLSASGTWKVTSSVASTFAVTATPNTFTLAPGATQTITFKATPNTLLTSFAFGTLILTEQSTPALSPPEHVTVAVQSTTAPPASVTCTAGTCTFKADQLVSSFSGLGCAAHAGCEFTWLNRYSPNPSDYPITLQSVSTIFAAPAGWNAAGDKVSVFVFVDNDSDPSNGATAVGTPTVFTMGTPANAFVTIPLNTPLVLNGPGDVIIALSNPDPGNVGGRPAALDAGPFLGRSYIADAPADGTVNPDLSLLNVDINSDPAGLNLPKNYVIRATGTNASGQPIVLGGYPGPSGN
jgi:subtilisin family serine protease